MMPSAAQAQSLQTIQSPSQLHYTGSDSSPRPIKRLHTEQDSGDEGGLNNSGDDRSDNDNDLDDSHDLVRNGKRKRPISVS
ncbi:hypothetical protein UCRPA7_5026 [Phaeoacremonium minimum UCRPA7]|uniref:Uncharacterized protein n=1 Tax=Phaeoacremonium minimum (strain UCR-PA7) TaxID=1286976 RepID=R8BJT3_PHAM7|nr:hypothetical protein UCRPA7_5026 [Phaeoacremonium minimum UCRPA7]EON99477.1 hypothetical protein UCRPA7_5026 [Phaeoacremonium minimum UCRPA7]